MRTIKFRGISVNTNKWVYGDLITKPIHHECCILESGCINHSVNPSTVGQFTGLHDKNGVEIYEGDVVETFNYFPRDAKVEPQIKNVVYKRHSFFYEKHDLDSDSRTLASEECIVIGNIHEKEDKV